MGSYGSFAPSLNSESAIVHAWKSRNSTTFQNLYTHPQCKPCQKSHVEHGSHQASARITRSTLNSHQSICHNHHQKTKQDVHCSHQQEPRRYEHFQRRATQHTRQNDAQHCTWNATKTARTHSRTTHRRWIKLGTQHVCHHLYTRNGPKVISLLNCRTRKW